MIAETIAWERGRALAIAVEQRGVDRVLDGGYTRHQRGVLVCEGVEEWYFQRKHLVDDHAERPDANAVRV